MLDRANRCALAAIVHALEVGTDLHALAERVARHAARGEDLLGLRRVGARTTGGQADASYEHNDDRRAERASKPEATKQLGVLLASGMIVGEGLVGVIIAAFVAFSGKDFPLAVVGDEFADNAAVWIGSGVFVLTVFLLYRWAARMRP